MAANPGLSNRQQMNAPIQPDATLRSTPETVLWGYIAANLAPALTIQAGRTVEIQVLSHQRLTTANDPEEFSAAYGMPNNEVLADAKKIFVVPRRPKAASVHIPTGPIYVEDAEPGDMLEVRV